MGFIEDNTDWIIGVSLAISANIISNLGLNFQKLAHSRREARKQKLQRRRKAPSAASKHASRHRHQSVQSQSAVSVAHSINDNRNVAGSVISRSNTSVLANP